ncbi:MAG TPA: 50S ribosomal protein L11 methyltransferase [Hyphomicrobiaceae bacterium]|nr:50S ribosomal protein L11 methyltransferase [Hyphomicrobiaceae bacterium]
MPDQAVLLLAPPLVPEVRLHLAEESLAIWQKTEEELGELNVPPPFWAFAWAGGQALARYVLDHPEVARGCATLDLGAGSGLAAIAAMKAGARHALSADPDAFSAAAAAVNAAANGVALETTTADLLDTPPGAFGLVLVGDLFYERTLAERVLAFVTAASAAGATVLVGDPMRSYFPRHRFVPVAEYNVPVTRELEDAEIKRAAVWRLKP